MTGKKAFYVLMVMAVGLWATSQAAEPAKPAPAAPAQPAPAAPGAAYVGNAPAPHWHDMPSAWADAFHHPVENLELGLDFRFRNEYSRNMFSMDKQFGDNPPRVPADSKAGNWNDGNWQRWRTRFSAVWKFDEDISLNTRLVWEFWTISNPDRSFSSPLSNQNTDFREAVFDRMNLTFKNAFDAPMTLTLGRQDIILGTGWLVLDGTPADGSRTIYFDAARATLDLRDTTALDLIYIQQYDDEEEWLMPIGHKDYIHSTQKTDEKGFILYVTDKSIENTQLEGYYIYKNEEPSDWSKFWNSSKGKNWSTTPGKDAEIHTFGGRLAVNFDEHWSGSGEVAKQFGKRDMQSMNGLGSNDKIMYAFNDELKNELHTTYEYLSGNDPETSADEKFDTLWGDWPQTQRGGDLQAYMWTFEGALGEVANLHRLGFGHSFKPNKEWTLGTDYNLLWADENTFSDGSGPYGAPAFSSGGNFRGQLFSWLATYSCCKNLKTHFMVDYFVPGSYYDGSTQDHAVFARFNVELTF